MDKKQAEVAADALMGELQRQQAIRSAHISSDYRALDWLAILLPGIAVVGAAPGFLGHRTLLGSGIGLLAGLVGGSRPRQP